MLTCYALTASFRRNVAIYFRTKARKFEN